MVTMIGLLSLNPQDAEAQSRLGRILMPESRRARRLLGTGRCSPDP